MSSWNISVYAGIFDCLKIAYCICRFGPMNAISLVGTKQEESGNYFEELIRVLEQCPFLCPLMPWGDLSVVDVSSPAESDDGPIFWIRPGEQLIRTDELFKDEQQHNATTTVSTTPTNINSSTTHVTTARGRKRSTNTTNSTRNVSLGLAIR